MDQGSKDVVISSFVRKNLWERWIKGQTLVRPEWGGTTPTRLSLSGRLSPILSISVWYNCLLDYFWNCTTVMAQFLATKTVASFGISLSSATRRSAIRTMATNRDRSTSGEFRLLQLIQF